ncbi:MAG: hypothetical protein HF314_17840 [Ignavibacteria bacterium]|jgi:hypothetical protein|nr:hypothetical protein [Ignavibacteria bacterium]MCU7504950.1 hypothetical protein [Ignavibacteria bacterium]MCU7514916.1 hypothetical protein [Ignavibacteria bacterium]
MDVKTYLICVAFTVALMVLFVFINFPYYRITYGSRAGRIAIRTILLNTLAIFIGWAPVVYFWAEFSLKYLLPFACTLGALGCVGSRFLYTEIIPEELAKTMLEIIERRAGASKEKDITKSTEK